MIDQILQAEGTGISIILIAAIVLALVVAFKIMEMVFDTVVITVASGAFYLVMRYFQGGAINFNDLLLFSFLGASLYMIYSLLATLYHAARTIVPIPYKLLKTLSKPFRYAYFKLEELSERDYSPDLNKKEEGKKGDEDKGGKTTKEVILGKDRDEDSEE